MAYLFIDTTDHLVIGLLDNEFNWLEYIDQSDKKNSGRIHWAVFQMLEKQGLEIKNLSGVIQIAGPGSYTGMRLSEGMVQVLEWNGIPSYSFHHFDIPKIHHETPFIWFSNAFKGEYFCYSWDGCQATTELISLNQIQKLVAETGLTCYTHFPNDVISGDIKSTSSLLHLHGQAFLQAIVRNKQRVEAYYYRDLDSEFTASFV